MPWVGLQYVIVACPGHTQINFCNLFGSFPLILQLADFFHQLCIIKYMLSTS